MINNDIQPDMTNEGQYVIIKHSSILASMLIIPALQRHHGTPRLPLRPAERTTWVTDLRQPKHYLLAKVMSTGEI